MGTKLSGFGKHKLQGEVCKGPVILTLFGSLQISEAFFPQAVRTVFTGQFG